MKTVRIDKWLWAVRLYKSRSKAKEACEKGRVRVNEQSVKPSRSVRTGDKLAIRKKDQRRLVSIVKIIGKRVASTIALECYEDITPVDWIVEKPLHFMGQPEKREKGSGRPTKKDRRDIGRVKGR